MFTPDQPRLGSRNVTGGIKLVIVDAGVPRDAGHRIEVADAESVVRPADIDGYALEADVRFDFVVGNDAHHGKRQPAIGNGVSGTQVGARKTPSKSFTSTPAAISPPIPKRSE